MSLTSTILAPVVFSELPPETIPQYIDQNNTEGRILHDIKYWKKLPIHEINDFCAHGHYDLGLDFYQKMCLFKFALQTDKNLEKPEHVFICRSLFYSLPHKNFLCRYTFKDAVMSNENNEHDQV